MQKNKAKADSGSFCGDIYSLTPGVCTGKIYGSEQLYNKITDKVKCCDDFRVGLTLNLYFASLRYTSPTFVASVVNTIAALTFVIAIALRLALIVIYIKNL